MRVPTLDAGYGSSPSKDALVPTLFLIGKDAANDRRGSGGSRALREQLVAPVGLRGAAIHCELGRER